jgi:hypothetical protein
MKLSLLTLATASLVSVSQGYKLSFYLGANCRNAQLGTQFPVVDPPNHVCRGVPINAQSVVITAQDPQDAQSSKFDSFLSPADGAGVTLMRVRVLSDFGCSRGLPAAGGMWRRRDRERHGRLRQYQQCQVLSDPLQMRDGKEVCGVEPTARESVELSSR